jgi:hypothetical protein
VSNQQKREQAKQRKRLVREKQYRKARNTAHNISLRDYILQLSRGPWGACYESGTLGMNQLLCVRKTMSGFGASVFLLDEYCLGVKDADVIRDVDVAVIEDQVRQRDGRMVTPAYALKKLTALIAWAREIGFDPHAKAYLAMEIFRDVDPDSCRDPFAFGRPEDGKPMFISGPKDSPDRIRSVLNKLQRLGQDNYHFMISTPEVFRHALVQELDEADSEDAEREIP